MFETYEKLLKEKGVKTADVARITGINPSVFSDWKKGKSVPKTDKLIKIADYFGVTVDFLTTGSDSETRELSPSDALLIAKVTKDAELCAALEKYYAMSDAKKKHVLELINLLSE